MSRIMAQPVTPCALEFMDGTAIDMVRDYSDLGLPMNACLLMIEVDGPSLESRPASPRYRQRRAEPAASRSTWRRPTTRSRACGAHARPCLSPALRNVAPKKSTKTSSFRYPGYRH